jgi:hypothetical protein
MVGIWTGPFLKWPFPYKTTVATTPSDSIFDPQHRTARSTSTVAVPDHDVPWWWKVGGESVILCGRSVNFSRKCPLALHDTRPLIELRATKGRPIRTRNPREVIMSCDFRPTSNTETHTGHSRVAEGQLDHWFPHELLGLRSTRERAIVFARQLRKN